MPTAAPSQPAANDSASVFVREADVAEAARLDAEHLRAQIPDVPEDFGLAAPQEDLCPACGEPRRPRGRRVRELRARLSRRMSRRVVVWGTGNVGRPAIRAVLSHRDLELVGVDRAQPRLQGLGGCKRNPAASPAATFASRP